MKNSSAFSKLSGNVLKISDRLCNEDFERIMTHYSQEGILEYRHMESIKKCTNMNQKFEMFLEIVKKRGVGRAEQIMKIMVEAFKDCGLEELANQLISEDSENLQHGYTPEVIQTMKTLWDYLSNKIFDKLIGKNRQLMVEALKDCGLEELANQLISEDSENLLHGYTPEVIQTMKTLWDYWSNKIFDKLIGINRQLPRETNTSSEDMALAINISHGIRASVDSGFSSCSPSGGTRTPQGPHTSIATPFSTLENSLTPNQFRSLPCHRQSSKIPKRIVQLPTVIEVHNHTQHKSPITQDRILQNQSSIPIPICKNQLKPKKSTSPGTASVRNPDVYECAVPYPKNPTPPQVKNQKRQSDTYLYGGPRKRKMGPASSFDISAAASKQKKTAELREEHQSTFRTGKKRGKSSLREPAEKSRRRYGTQNHPQDGLPVPVAGSCSTSIDNKNPTAMDPKQFVENFKENMNRTSQSCQNSLQPLCRFFQSKKVGSNKRGEMIPAMTQAEIQTILQNPFMDNASKTYRLFEMLITRHPSSKLLKEVIKEAFDNIELPQILEGF